MKSFEEFYSTIKEKYHLNDDQVIPFMSNLINTLEEGKKKKKKREDEEGKAPKTGHEKVDKNLGFEDPLADYPEQKRIY
jgi:hypothetical protein|tara:strand:- start:294 stop:530 length:237 start_codon:yes stop_codon:yes gene_type:complete